MMMILIKNKNKFNIYLIHTGTFLSDVKLEGLQRSCPFSVDLRELNNNT